MCFIAFKNHFSVFLVLSTGFYTLFLCAIYNKNISQENIFLSGSHLNYMNPVLNLSCLKGILSEIMIL